MIHTDTRTHSDHALVCFGWERRTKKKKSMLFLVVRKGIANESSGSREKSVQINIYFAVNRQTADEHIVWDTFKAYIRGI